MGIQYYNILKEHNMLHQLCLSRDVHPLLSVEMNEHSSIFQRDCFLLNKVKTTEMGTLLVLVEQIHP